MTDELDDEMLEDFLRESRDGLAAVEPLLVKLESTKGPDGRADKASLDRLFRVFHTIKGTAGFLGLDQTVRLTHAAESLMDRFREGELEVQTAHVDALCDVVDVLHGMIADIARRQGDRNAAPAVDACLAALADCAPHPGSNAAEADGGAGGADGVDDPEAPAAFSFDAAARAVEAAMAAAAAVAAPEPAPAPRPASPAATLPQAMPAASAPAPQAPAAEARPPAAGAASDAHEPEPNAARAAPAAESAKATLRVDVSKLDTLVALVGQLVIAETAISHDPSLRSPEFSGVAKLAQQLGRVVRSLQDVTLAMRMVPLTATFQRMPRLVRDVSQRVGKPVELVLEGGETEIDKSLVEAVADPLVHLARNSLDHGIESESDRRAVGKPPHGTLRISASQQGGEVWIRVADDGRGLDRERLLAKALSKGLVDPLRVPAMTDQDVHELLFLPGFSTAEKVTDISGRGVGMDVVRRNLEAVRGRIDIESKKGVGTTMTLRMPLTLAIVDSMLFRVGHTAYSVPILALREILRVSDGAVTTLDDGRAFVDVRGTFAPLYRLDRLHGIETRAGAVSEGIVLVVEDDRGLACVLADDVIGQRQIVIKPLGPVIGSIQGLSGCAVLGDGEIVLVLDLGALRRRAEQPPSRRRSIPVMEERS